MDSGSRLGTDSGAARVVQAGPIRVDVSACRASLAGEALNLTPTEFRLLRALAERPSRTQSRKQLLEKAWSETSAVADRAKHALWTST